MENVSAPTLNFDKISRLFKVKLSEATEEEKKEIEQFEALV